MLSSRTEQILCSIVRAYIESGEPVASGSISKLRRYNLSPASIRNIMGDLASDGYLQQPHTSAGRIPTEKAFQLYVHGLEAKRLHQDRLGFVRGRLNGAASMEERVERCSHILTELTNGLGIAAAIPTASHALDRIELVSLGERRVVMVVVTKDKMVWDRVVVLEQGVTQDELNTIRNYVNQNFGGWVISEVQVELKRRLEEASAAYDEILRKLILLHEKGLLNVGQAPEVHMEGASNLVSFDFHVTRERLKEMFHALEQKQLILDLLDRFLEDRSGKVGVKVGLGDHDPRFGELSLIGVTVNTPGGMSAKIAVVGPVRMDYESAVSAVLHVGRAFGSLPS